ncbi:flagellar biosynthetic protein FliR [Acidithiobacillus thiooxidans]|uniref:flagellar biosynthetic protein FliR n=1 Tax=Acidithiobacillus thiooxidans TaxID=930 RepID=UPI001C068B81|nr:flagellar biosynthetic protein FliR [Acidithiobacillus thiooxidans]MBU2791872.1 flagellar biosynthetic protein FliR [Acidithiobacillus thiooxidans]
MHGVPELITFTQAQANRVVEEVVWPTTRILAFIAVAPLFSSGWLPTLWRLGFGLACAWAIIPALSPMMPWPGMGGAAVVILAQVVIGLTIGFLFRFLVSIFEFAAGWIALTMGLGFATTISSQYGEQNSTLGEIFKYGVVFLLIADGGIMGMLHVLSESFQIVPVGMFWPHWNWLHFANFGQVIFTEGVLMALPVVLMLMVVNVGMAIIARVAPQINLFAVGFPIMIMVGLAGIYVLIPYLPRMVTHLFLLLTAKALPV